MSIKHELQSIIFGNGFVRNGENIQAILNYLRRKKEAISNDKAEKLIKVKETQILIEYFSRAKLWYSKIDQSKYIGEGAEQKIFEFDDPEYVLKFNTGIFYTSWSDYLSNLLIHNYFFPHLAYELLGFTTVEDKLHAVVKQPYVRATETTSLQNVKDFLLANGFINKKANDYFHPGLGIILEDLHDENVLTSDGVLFN